MLKKFGLQSSSNKDLDPPPRLSSTHINSSSTSSAPTSPLRTTNQEKKNPAKKKALRAVASHDSMDSLAPRPHLPSTVYEPNPFPLDPTQPDGVSRFNAYTAKHTRKETREVETVDLDIEVEETKGFVSGRSRQSVELERGVRSEYVREVDMEESEYEVSRRTNTTAMSKFGAGLKGALAKTGLVKTQDKERALATSTKETGASANKPEEVDAVLQHHLQIQQQQQELHIREQEQHYHQQQRYAQEQDVVSSSRGQRGRPRERQRTRSGPIHHQGRPGLNGAGGRGSRVRDEEDTGSSSYHKERESRETFQDRRARLHSLSPPPAPGQEHRGSAAYWPNGREGSHPDDQEQMSPFLPQTSSSHYQPNSRSQQQQQQQYGRSRALSQASDSDNGEYSRHANGDRRRLQSRERNNNEADRMRRDIAGQRRQSGLYQVTNAASTNKTSSELGDEERLSSREDRHRSPQRSVPDRLSRAKEWVASHSKNSSIATPAPVMDREVALASLPGAFPSRSPHRRSMDSFDDYSIITPPRGSYFANAGRGSGGYDPRERIAMVDQIRMQDLQRSGYRHSMSAVEDDGRYWNRQLEGYEQRDRYRQNRVDYEYEGGGGQGGPYYGYAPGGPDDLDQYDETDSTLAPGSATDGFSKGKVAGLEKSPDANRKLGLDGRTPVLPAVGGDEEGQVLQAKPPNKRRLILRLISLSSSILVLVLLIAASPVSKASSPFSTQAGLAFHYVVSIISTLVSLAFVFNYFSRRLRRQEKMKRYLLFGLDILMSLLWLIDVFICISKFPCGVGELNGWCDMYNSSIFLSIIAFLSFLAAFIWDIWGSFDHSDSKLFGKGPWIKPPPPGFDRKPLAKQGAGVGRQPGQQMQMQGQGGVPPGAYPGQGMGQVPGQGGAPLKKPKNSKALW